MTRSSGADSGVQVGVVLLTLDQKEKTLRCIASFEQVRKPTFRLVLLDNASRDGTLAAVRSTHPDVITHYSSENLGVASGRNTAAEIAIRELSPEYLFFLDNDMEVSAGVLSELTDVVRESAGIGLSTGKILMLEDRKRIYGAGGCYVDFSKGRTGHVGYGEMDQGQYDQPHPCLPSGGCMLVKTDLFQQLRGFDADFDPYGPEDLDFGLRSRQAGYAGIYAPRAVIFHESTPGHTFEGGMASSAYVSNKTRLWFRLMRRHATLRDWAMFAAWGAPIGMIRMIVREARRGNLSAMRGLFGGVVGNGKTNKPDRSS